SGWAATTLQRSGRSLRITTAESPSAAPLGSVRCTVPAIELLMLSNSTSGVVSVGLAPPTMRLSGFPHAAAASERAISSRDTTGSITGPANAVASGLDAV